MLAKSAAIEEGLPQVVVAARDGVQSWLAIQVIDSGRGIPLADHERVFEEFEQVDAGPRADSPNRGTGLGLAISRRLARLLGGDLLLSSEPGKGSTFTVWLPASEAESRPL
jgi:signal transduction histidine kinase